MDNERLQEIKDDIANWFNLSEDCHAVLDELITALEDDQNETEQLHNLVDEIEAELAARTELLEARDKINDYEHEVEVLEEADFADRKYREEIREDFYKQLAEAQREISNLHRKIKAMVTGKVAGE